MTPIGTHFCVLDSVGNTYLNTFQDDTPAKRAAFRRHAAQWVCWAKSREGAEVLNATAMGAPAFPVAVVIG
jgi:hypothetical protein